ncbi:MAG: MFS transporter [Lachnospiraceae bacterium]|nr:MFS transporter [Lachnospiraceae bacterium]
MEKKLFSRDFTLVVIGQIVSLFGNAAIRFALPLYLLNQTGSAALYGVVTACAFLPSVILSPLGGIIADRVNKRNIMVVLDFFTAAVLTGFFLFSSAEGFSSGDGLAVLLTVTMMILYGIAGAYQPAVQASVPALTGKENLMAANSVINVISSLAALFGPVFGGILYSAYGLRPVLILCVACFFLSAVMECFIQIPHVRRERKGSVWETVRADFSESFYFIWREKPVVGKGILAAFGLNLFLSAMLVVGIPYLVTEVFLLEPSQANRLCGFAQGSLAAGGLAGGILVGVFGKRLTIQKAGILLMACAACVFPIAGALFFIPSGMGNFLVLSFCSFGVMLLATMFTVQVMSFVQEETPPALVGKVISLIMAVSMCAQPLGSGLYGFLFEALADFEFAVVLFSGVCSFLVAFFTRKIFRDFQTGR